MKFKYVTMIAAVCSWSLLSAVPASAAEATKVNLITGPFGTGSYVLGNALEQLSKKYSKTVEISSSETPGLVFNARKMDKEADLKKLTMMSFTTGINYLTTEGIKPFKKKYPSAKLISNYNLGSVWLATFDPEIRTAQDLIGKTIALGRPPQILWTVEPEQIINTGWGLKGKINVERLGTKQAAQALLDGSVDAAIIGGYADPISGTFSPSPQTVELVGSGKTLYHIPWGQEAVQKVIDNGISIKTLTVPAGAVAGMDKPTEVFFDAIAWVAYPEMDEQSAYEVTKLIIDQVEGFKEYHALGKLMSKGSLAHGWKAEDIHPGALRAYQEAGLIP
ncbi:TAXI family TRAP transporter solute-binding subunit [Kiloniella sp.]|uniref:TAXI family TRAP transporter solute-binding subunit n=1 Tax=Kiloniella sp. TaxID=1938587 RepID=UPI003B02366F